MSDSTWLGSTPLAWCDHNLALCDSMEALCMKAKWKLPAKAYAPNREIMAQFLTVMEEHHCMIWDDFWVLKIGSGEDGCEWDEYTNTPTKASVEVMEMFADFMKAVGESPQNS